MASGRMKNCGNLNDFPIRIKKQKVCSDVFVHVTTTISASAVPYNG